MSISLTSDFEAEIHLNPGSPRADGVKICEPMAGDCGFLPVSELENLLDICYNADQMPVISRNPYGLSVDVVGAVSMLGDLFAVVDTDGHVWFSNTSGYVKESHLERVVRAVRQQSQSGGVRVSQ